MDAALVYGCGVLNYITKHFKRAPHLDPESHGTHRLHRNDRKRPLRLLTPLTAKLMLPLKVKLQNLKSLKDEGLISDSDFEEQKRRLLGQL